MSSDIAMRNGLPYRISAQRSQSALGAAGGYRQPSLSKSADHMQTGTDEDDTHPTYMVSIARESALQSLTENHVARLEEGEEFAQESRLDNFLSPTFGPFTDNGNGQGLQRSASAAQMRDIKDIKDQMKDLKGKISSLREQARVDSMKRRSLQSLRTPSPFTHSQIDQWYADRGSDRNSTVSSSGALPAKSPWNGEESSIDGDAVQALAEAIHQDSYVEEGESVYSEAHSGTQLKPAGGRSPAGISAPLSATGVDDAGLEVEDDSDVVTENGDPPEEEDLPAGFHDAMDMGYESESGDSLYHDTVQHQISHEDREDAFDYEHFFLHSAMGTMSQQRLLRRGSTGSYTSDDSTETTRGPVAGTQPGGVEGDENTLGPDKPAHRSRRNSTASISTIETFATAEEERARRSGEVSRLDGVIEDEFVPSAGSSPNSQRNRSDATTTSSRSPITTSGHPSMSNIMSLARDNSDGSISSIPEEGTEDGEGYQPSRRHSAFRRPISFSTSHSMHRPSVSSFDSTGTNRSFPLVNKPKRANSTGVLTPNSSPDQELKNISDTLLSETVNVCDRLNEEGPATGDRANDRARLPQTMQNLLREDKYLVERMVAGLGRCVLGLTESGRASAESRMYRRRIDMARRILEGLEGEEDE